MSNGEHSFDILTRLVCMKLLKACGLGARDAAASNWEPFQYLIVMLVRILACGVHDEDTLERGASARQSAGLPLVSSCDAKLLVNY